MPTPNPSRVREGGNSMWTAIIPFNYGRPCKTRLAPVLSVEERDALAMAMALHVVGVVGQVPAIDSAHLLAPVDPILPGAQWLRDDGRGINSELAAARAASPGQPILIIHADLPLLAPSDVETLLRAAAVSGAAIAPDAAGRGTNAIALADDRAFVPAFGADSLAAHRSALPGAPLVDTPGLTLDVDDADSLHHAAQRGFVLPRGMRIAPSI
ncbi:MAG: 2-phospho-L-lactate guanylyltransferase [Sphingobium sp.]